MNKVILKGRIMDELEGRHTKDGKLFVTGRLSTSEKRDGEWVYENHNISFWGKSAENAQKYIKKGSNILIDGKINYTARGDADKKIWYTNIIVNYFESCDPFKKKENHYNDYTKEQLESDDVPF